MTFIFFILIVWSILAANRSLYYNWSLKGPMYWRHVTFGYLIYWYSFPLVKVLATFVIQYWKQINKKTADVAKVNDDLISNTVAVVGQNVFRQRSKDLQSQFLVNQCQIFSFKQNTALRTQISSSGSIRNFRVLTVSWSIGFLQFVDLSSSVTRPHWLILRYVKCYQQVVDDVQSCIRRARLVELKTDRQTDRQTKRQTGK